MSLSFKREAVFQDKVDLLIDDQVVNWGMARTNYEGLKEVKSRSVEFGAFSEMRIQFNAARMRSSAAKVDARSISERKCFLCADNLPEEQDWLMFGDDYLVLVNPFPIFPRHLTIPHKLHVDQRIEGRLKDMMELAKALPGFTLFYNGPRCGASAPDHFHFQAGNKGFLPVEKEHAFHPAKSLLLNKESISVYSIENYLRKTLVIEGNDPELIDSWFSRVYNFLGSVQREKEEPMLNILCSWEADHWRLFVFPRKEHRPKQFFAEGEEKILLSPASVDFGGVLITPREEDFTKLNKDLIRDIFEQVTLNDGDWNNLKKIFINT